MLHLKYFIKNVMLLLSVVGMNGLRRSINLPNKFTVNELRARPNGFKSSGVTLKKNMHKCLAIGLFNVLSPHAQSRGKRVTRKNSKSLVYLWGHHLI